MSRRKVIAFLASVLGVSLLADGLLVRPSRILAATTRPSQKPVDRPVLAATLKEIATDLERADMSARAKALEALAGRLLADQPVTTMDMDEVEKLAEQLRALAKTYRAIRPKRSEMLAHNAQRLSDVATDLGKLAKTTPPAPSNPGAQLKQLTVRLSYRRVVRQRPTVPPRTPVRMPRRPSGRPSIPGLPRGGTSPPRRLPPPPPPTVPRYSAPGGANGRLSIELVELNAHFTTVAVLSRYLDSQLRGRLNGTAVTVRCDPEVTFRDLQAVVSALARVHEIASITVADLALRTAAAQPVRPAGRRPLRPGTPPVVPPQPLPPRSAPPLPPSSPTTPTPPRPTAPARQNFAPLGREAFAAMGAGNNVVFVLDCRPRNKQIVMMAVSRAVKQMRAGSKFTVFELGPDSKLRKVGTFPAGDAGLRQLQRRSGPTPPHIPGQPRPVITPDLAAALAAGLAAGGDVVNVLSESTTAPVNLASRLGARKGSVRVNALLITNTNPEPPQSVRELTDGTGGKVWVTNTRMLMQSVLGR